MKIFPFPSYGSPGFGLVLAISAIVFCQSARATLLYWDSNGTAVGALNGPEAIGASGTWGIDNFWTTDASGTAAGTYQSTTTASDTLYFWVNPAATAPLVSSASNFVYTVTVSGTQAANGLIVQSANSTGGRVDLTLTGGQVDLGSGGITIDKFATGSLGNVSRFNIYNTINLTANQVWTANVSTNNGGFYINGDLTGSGNLEKFSNNSNSYFTFQSGTSTGWTGSLTLNGGSVNL